MTSPRTILFLSAKRCGSTAMFRLFQKHPQVGVAHTNQTIENWEPNFWSQAARAVAGDPIPFLERLAKSHPDLPLPVTVTEQAVFDLWDGILTLRGPVVFDKSPAYLGDRAALDLINGYIKKGRDMRILGMIRDPRDAITSQFELWGARVPGDSPARREEIWLDQYRHMEELQAVHHFPVFRYEDFSQVPFCYAPAIFELCGIDYFPQTWGHVKPTHIGRYSISPVPEIRAWRMSAEFLAHLAKYGYPTPQVGFNLSRTLSVTARTVFFRMRRALEKSK